MLSGVNIENGPGCDAPEYCYHVSLAPLVNLSSRRHFYFHSLSTWFLLHQFPIFRRLSVSKVTKGGGQGVRCGGILYGPTRIMLVFGLSRTDQKKILKKKYSYPPPHFHFKKISRHFWGVFRKNHSNGCPDPQKKGRSIFLSLFFNSSIEEQKLVEKKFHKISSSWVQRAKRRQKKPFF